MGINNSGDLGAWFARLTYTVNCAMIPEPYVIPEIPASTYILYDQTIPIIDCELPTFNGLVTWHPATGVFPPS